MPDTLPHRDRSRPRSSGVNSTPAGPNGKGYNPETDAEEDDWDRQIEEDAKAGRLDMLAERARTQYQAGHATDLEGNPAETRS